MWRNTPDRDWRHFAMTHFQMHFTAHAGKIQRFFWPFQLGAGVKHGSEAAALVARDFIECAERDQAFVKIDFANAFNSVRRDVIFEQN